MLSEASGRARLRRVDHETQRRHGHEVAVPGLGEPVLRLLPIDQLAEALDDEPLFGERLRGDQTPRSILFPDVDLRAPSQVELPVVTGAAVDAAVLVRALDGLGPVKHCSQSTPMDFSLKNRSF